MSMSEGSLAGIAVGGEVRVEAPLCERCGRRPATRLVEIGKTRSGSPFALRVCEQCELDVKPEVKLEVEPGSKPSLCENCEVRQPTNLVRAGTKLGKAGLPLAVWLCSACTPAEPSPAELPKAGSLPKRPRRKTRNRRATTDFHERVEEILYRQAGATASQVARWLVLMTADFDGRPDPYRSALEAAYRTLRAMREAGVAEAIAIRRSWLGKKSGVAGSGRREDFYRLKKDGDGVVEGGVLADVEGVLAKKGYARPWFGGGTEHAAHRNDAMLLFAEQAQEWGVEVDPFSAYGETHPDFPLVGYEKPRVDEAGEEKAARENARHTYDKVVPDGEFVAVFTEADAGESPGQDTQESGYGENSQYGGFHEEGSYEESESFTGSSASEAEEVFA